MPLLAHFVGDNIMLMCLIPRDVNFDRLVTVVSARVLHCYYLFLCN